MRLPSSDYFDAERAVEHCAQGDVYEGVPFLHASGVAESDVPRGQRKRPASEPEFAIAQPALIAPGVVCSYTCGFMAQPPGTPGYSHSFRSMAPILSLRELKRLRIGNGDLRRVRDEGGVNGIMYLPSPEPEPDEPDDEWKGHSAILLYRTALVTQELLDSRRRTRRLSLEAQKILCVRLIQVYSPNLFDPLDENLLEPDRSDSWATQT